MNIICDIKDCILCNEDCMELLSGIPSNYIQLVITSPPYNLGKEYEKKMDLNNYIDGQAEVIKECYRVLKPEGSICWQVGNYVNKGAIIPLDIVLFDIFRSLGMQLRNRIIWCFGHGLHCSKRFSGRYETILWFTKTDDYIFNLDDVRVPQKYPGKKHFRGERAGQPSCNPLGKNPSDIWDIPNVKNNHVEKTEHPCQFPAALVGRLVLALSNDADYVVDPFMGVGTTPAVALMYKRKAIGAEIIEKYYNIAVERCRQAKNGELKIREDVPVFEPVKKNEE